jgi:hypothetical protein
MRPFFGCRRPRLWSRAASSLPQPRTAACRGVDVQAFLRRRALELVVEDEEAA